MIVIEDRSQLRFYEGKTELTLREGFERLDRIYGNEPQETKRVIDRLREKYRKDLFKQTSLFQWLYVECARLYVLRSVRGLCLCKDDRPQSEYDFNVVLQI